MSLELVGFIKSLGYLGTWGVLFAECGILFGVLLPGDSLLFTLGILARRGMFELDIMIAGCVASAFLGNLFGYEIGKRYGLKFFKKYARRFITEDQLDKTNTFFNKHGITTIILARFVPIMRTITPFLAGVVRMDYRMFVVHSFIGSLIWAGGLPLLGFYFGRFIPDEWMELLAVPVVLIILGIITWPYIQKYRQTRARRHKLVERKKEHKAKHHAEG